MGSSGRRQLKAMLRKNWLLKIRHPFITCAEILLSSVVMLILIAIRERSDTTIHPVDEYIRRGMLVEVGKSEISPSFNTILKSLLANGEFLAFAPDKNQTRLFVDVLSQKFPLLKMVARIYHDELELESYIKSDSYGVNDQLRPGYWIDSQNHMATEGVELLTNKEKNIHCLVKLHQFCLMSSTRPFVLTSFVVGKRGSVRKIRTVAPIPPITEQGL